MAVTEWGQRLEFRSKFQQFASRSDAKQIASILRIFLTDFVKESPRLWSVSCLPSTNKSSWPRIFCVNQSQMEVFVLGYLKDEPDNYWAFINVSYSAFKNIEFFVRDYPTAELNLIDYQAAQGDALNIQIEGLNNIIAVIKDVSVLNAAKSLYSRLGPSNYEQYHCYDLVDYAFERSIPQRQQVSPDTVQIGSIVKIQEVNFDPESYKIVFENSSVKGEISSESPMGNSLLGHRAGETVIIHSPQGDYKVKILEVTQSN